MIYLADFNGVIMKVEQESYSLATCNIEGDKHIKRVKDFLQSYSPQIVCFQEAPETEIINLANDLDYQYAFRANALFKTTLIPGLKQDQRMGLAIMSRIPIQAKDQLTYFGDEDNLPVYIHRQPNTRRREILYIDLPQQLRIATTHFTWAPNGSINDKQRHDIQPMLAAARLLGECIFAGDFNMPRPNELYQLVTTHFNDHIPLIYKSSLDPDIHPQSKKLQLLIDYIFSTPTYNIQQIEFVSGVSDHMAIVASFNRQESI